MNAVSIGSSPAEPSSSAIPQTCLRGQLQRPHHKIAIGNPVAAQIALNSVAIGYWAVFWFMNGLDKFLNRSDIGWINWYGKDRSEQFGEYFDRLDLAPGAIDGLLAFTGLWEFLVALPLIAALAAILTRPNAALTQSLMYWGYVLTGLTLIGFSAFDVVAGDRAELREHGLYLALMFVCCLWCKQQAQAESH
ncbi:hypothetical protein [Pelagibius sp. Alg239-R121]|uniref:hypothetical protein n=1 Tax=Pelagibius sp. Alg239-R121 TaxID=2993448 RepID=UPI0024A6D35C|nr:hypothetical protein [Pelagibius sp. Alg239-R121]